MEKKSIPELSADAAILIAELSKKEKGTDVPWEEIERLVGWRLRNNQSVMGTVRNRLRRDHGLVLGTITGVGKRILTDAEVAEGELSKDRERRRRSAKKSKKKAAAVDLSNLNETQKLKLLGEVTAAHVVAEASETKSVAKIETQLNGAGTPMALNHALDAIKKQS